MAVEIASLQATIGADVSGLQHGLRTAKDMLRGMVDDMRGAQSAATGLNSGLLNLNAAVGVFGALKNAAAGLIGALKAPVDAIASYERLGMTLQTLAAREIMAEHTVTRTVAAGQRWVAATNEQIVVAGKSKKSVDDVKFAMEGAAIKIAQAQAALDKLNASGKATPVQLQAAAHRLEAAKRAYADYGDQIKTIPAQEGRYVTVTKQVTETTISKAEAWRLAGERARELQAWVERLAIQSPFNREDVAQSFRMAMTFGATTEEAKRLTQAMMDFAAGSGATGETMQRISLSMGQMRAAGKLTGAEIRELALAGVPVKQILAKALNLTSKQLENLGDGTVDAKKGLEAITRWMEEDFGGAAKAQAGTFSGLISSLQDLNDTVMRDFFTPIATVVKPALEGFVNALQDPVIREALQGIGTFLGNLIKGPVDFFVRGFKTVSIVLDNFKLALGSGARPVMALRYALMQALPKETVERFDFLWLAADRFFTTLEKTQDPLAALKDGLGTLRVELEKLVTASTIPEWLKAPLMGTIDFVVDIPTALAESVKKIQQGDLAGALKPIEDLVDTWFYASIAPLFPGLVSGLWDFVKPGLDDLVTNIAKWLNGEFDLGAEIEKAIYGAKPEFTRRIDVWETMEMYPNPPAYQIELAKLGGTISKQIEGWGDQIKEAAESLGKRLMEEFKAAVETKAKELGPFFGDIVRGIWAPITGQEPQGPLGGMMAQGPIPWLIGQVPNMAQQGPTSWFINQIKAAFGDVEKTGKQVGADLSKGVAAGIMTPEAATAIKQNATKVVDDGMQGVMEKYGIRSPSTVTADTIGKPLAQGIALGITQGMSDVEVALGLLDLYLARATARMIAGGVALGRAAAGSVASGAAMAAAGAATTGAATTGAAAAGPSSTTVTTKVPVVASPSYAGIAAGAPMPLDLVTSISDAVRDYVGAVSVGIDVPVKARPSYAGIAAGAPMPLDLVTSISDAVRNYVGAVSVGIDVPVRASPNYVGVDAMLPFELAGSVTQGVKDYVGQIAISIEATVSSVPTYTGVSAAASLPFELAGQMNRSVKNYIGKVPVAIETQVSAVPIYVGISAAALMPFELAAQITKSVKDYIGQVAVSITVPVRAVPVVDGITATTEDEAGQTGKKKKGVDGVAAAAASGAGDTHIHFNLDGREVAVATIDRLTGMVYEDSRR